MGFNWNNPSKMDRANLEQIHRKFGTVPLKTFPKLGKVDQIFYDCLGIKKINLLEYSICDYSIIRKTLIDSFFWKDYGVKHGESTFTRFYQSYYLPRKFGFDKRRAHLSDQINSKHISRSHALLELEKPVYASKIEELNELRYVTNKLEISLAEMEQFINSPNQSHQAYDSPLKNKGISVRFIDRFWFNIFKVCRKIGAWSK
jgi:hypothetical protein